MKVKFIGIQNFLTGLLLSQMRTPQHYRMCSSKMSPGIQKENYLDQEIKRKTISTNIKHLSKLMK